MEKTGIELIAEERIRQVEKEGWSATHDATHNRGELAVVASIYAMPSGKRSLKIIPDAFDPRGCRLVPKKWPWPNDTISWKPTPHDRIRELVKAGALIAAEIDRIQAGKL